MKEMPQAVFDALSLEEKDKVLVERLRRFGDELGRARRVTHCLQQGHITLVSARLRMEMKEHGFLHQETIKQPLANGVLVKMFYFQRTQPVDLDTVQKMTMLCRQVGAKYRCHYLGWQTQPACVLEDRGNA